MTDWPLVLITLLTFIPIALIVTLTPFLTRRTESFGVTITEEAHAHPINKQYRKQYAIVMGIFGALFTSSIIILLFTLEEHSWAIALPIHLLAIIFISFIVYLTYHFKVKKLKQEHGWSGPVQLQRVVIDTSFHTQKVVHSAWWFLPQGLIMLVTLLIGILQYDRFPDLIPLNYDLTGNVTHYAEKSYSTVLWPVAIQAMMIMIMVFAHVAILRSKQQVDAANPKASLKRNIIFRRRWSAFLFVLGFLISVLFLTTQLAILYTMKPMIVMIISLSITGITLVYAIWLSIITGQGGSRIKIDGEPAANIVSGQTNIDDDKYWKLGQFYFNRDDPSYFVEKRFGVGWTINLARPLAWIILLLICTLPIILTFILT